MNTGAFLEQIRLLHAEGIILFIEELSRGIYMWESVSENCGNTYFQW